jgi:hypothetical protein
MQWIRGRGPLKLAVGRNEMKWRAIFTGFCIIAVLSSCMRQQQRHSRILQLYSRVGPGMTRQEVENILGPPLFPAIHQPEVGPDYLGPGDTHPEGDACWYLQDAERSLSPEESPWGLGGIKIVYRDGRVIQKTYNAQWVKREDIEAFERTAQQSASANGATPRR